jgi:hypothetical protein
VHAKREEHSGRNEPGKHERPSRAVYAHTASILPWADAHAPEVA